MSKARHSPLSGSEALRFDGRVAVVTGAGNGLGRSHARLLASRGARVVVNDLGVNLDGQKAGEDAAASVAEEITAQGNEAVANTEPVQHGDRIIEAALDHFGGIDILINNAGILRDRAFHKMTEEDWTEVYDVHVRGSYKTAHAAWPHMRAQKYGRLVFTVSGSGLYGNFGQANYAMAKLGTHGLAQTLAIEGGGRNIVVNSVAPAAGSRLPAHIWPKPFLDALKPEYVSNLVAFLCHESCPHTGGLFEAGGGWISRLRWQRSTGVSFPLDNSWGPEDVAREFVRISDFSGGGFPSSVLHAFDPILANLPEEAAAAWLEATGQANADPK